MDIPNFANLVGWFYNIICIVSKGIDYHLSQKFFLIIAYIIQSNIVKNLSQLRYLLRLRH